MRLFELSPRLRAVADRVPAGARFADVGTDHAYLPVWLLLRGDISSAVASDLRQGPLDRARRTAQRYGVTERISFRLCDGLSGIAPEEADTIAIAGMGGETIAAILSAAPWTRSGACRLLLQPMSAVPDLRGCLQANGYRIEGEALIREGDTTYHLLEAAPGEMEPLTPAQRWAGRQDAGQDPALRGELLDVLVRRAEKALAGIRRSVRPSDAPRREELEQVYTGLIEMKKEWDAWQR
ncbi:hypothetical protein CE91St41_17940 [Oscillospiraceae bacterium]|nr:hypothetical protein CE91St40_19590 [Oscillospiraceae bacterium]BDF74905.1 hypothetical protein CE91St41_17940 [Oscillospiraceae bacterium]